MGVETVIGAGLGLSAVGSVLGGISQANAANDQRGAAEKTAYAATQAAKPSFQEMQAIQSQLDMSHNLLTTQITNLQQQQQLYQQSAGIASDLMAGKDSPVLKGLQYQNQLQRTQLENKLRDQLGSGYEASTAGSQALAAFDAQQSYVMNNAQQQAIGQYTSLAGQLGGQITQGYNQSYGLSGELNNQAIGAMQNNQQMQIGAITGTANNLISTAGANSVGGAFLGGSLSSMGNTAAMAGLTSLQKSPATNFNINIPAAKG